MGRGFGVDIDTGNEESGKFSFLKKKQNITRGRKESKEGRHSERKSQQRIDLMETGKERMKKKEERKKEA